VGDDQKQNPSPKSDLTRRQWLLRLGKAAILVGFSGVAGEVPADAQELQPSPGKKLPPGLYEPMGITLATPWSATGGFTPFRRAARPTISAR